MGLWTKYAGMGRVGENFSQECKVGTELGMKYAGTVGW